MSVMSPFPTVASPDLPQDRRATLRALLSFLSRYLLLGAPEGIGLPAGFLPLAGLPATPFVSEGYVSTLLCWALLGFLVMSARRRLARKQAAGGWATPNRYTALDLLHVPLEIGALRRLGSLALCQLLGQELRRLVRLLRVSQWAYWRAARNLPILPGQPDWRDTHRAAVLALYNIAHISARLRERGSRWYAEQCVRWQLFLLWQEVFGERFPVGSMCEWLFQLGDVPDWAERRVTRWLLGERARGLAVPAPFAHLIAAWERGELVLPPLKSRYASCWPSIRVTESGSDGLRSWYTERRVSLFNFLV
ncbi:MAG TPA: hypothetical protein VH540_15985 [Ktedonobacterales bacterium]